MIKINLLGDVKAVDHSAVFFYGGWISSLLTILIGMFLYSSSISSQTEELASEVELLEVQLKNLKERTKSVADLERKKAELDEKLRVIGVLKKSKSGPVRVLDDLNIAIPERSWLTAVNENDTVLRIGGFALDNQTVATFMKDLARSDYFERVDLIESKASLRDGVKLRQFILDAKVNYAGKIKLAPSADPATKDPATNKSPESEPTKGNSTASTLTPTPNAAATGKSKAEIEEDDL